MNTFDKILRHIESFFLLNYYIALILIKSRFSISFSNAVRIVTIVAESVLKRLQSLKNSLLRDRGFK